MIKRYVMGVESVRTRRWILGSGLAAIAFSGRARAQRPYEPLDPRKAQSLPLTPLAIVASGKSTPFQVEVARTDRQHAVGLMHRTELAPDRGMLFLFKPPRPITFWMRNTFIPLDMIFTDAKGTITYIAADVQPHVETPVGPSRASGAVLEVAAGTAKRLGLKPGDRLQHEVFDAAD